MQIVDIQHTYFLLKFLYFAETIIFTFSGKNELVTSYIVFHHSTMPLMLWWFTNFMPGGHSLFFGVVNLSSHVLLMVYHTSTTLFPSLKRSWGRSYIMWVHIVQFSLIILHWSQLAFANYCDYPTQMLYIGLGWGFSIYLLYCRAWLMTKKQQPEE